MPGLPKANPPPAESAPPDRPALPPDPPVGYCLRLYITGATPRSTRAVHSIQRICESYLQGQYTLEVVDLFQKPERASEAQVIAAPTLVKETPTPVRRFVGDMSDERRILGGLGLSAQAGT